MFSSSVSASLISPADTWGVWAALLAASATGLWSEKTEWGRRLSGPLVSTLAGLVLSNVGIAPSSASAYKVVNKFILPLAVPLLLFSADLRRVLRETGRLLLAFVLGSFATLAGTLTALKLLPLRSLGEDGWKVASALMARHIGGAINYVAVADSLALSPSVQAAGLAADNLACALYFATIFSIPLLSSDPSSRNTPNTNNTTQQLDTPIIDEALAAVTPLDLSKSLAAAALFCVAGVRLAAALNYRGGDIPCITAITVALATLIPKELSRLSPAGDLLSTVLMHVFFVTVGMEGSIANVINTAPALFLWCVLQIGVHLAVIMGVGERLGFHRSELLMASNANVGGPTTAAGMASAKGWRTLVMPGILAGILGYAVATFVSIAIGFVLLRRM
eukprot:jgi/Chlat1/8504/Chrsp80S00639